MVFWGGKYSGDPGNISVKFTPFLLNWVKMSADNIKICPRVVKRSAQNDRVSQKNVEYGAGNGVSVSGGGGRNECLFPVL